MSLSNTVTAAFASIALAATGAGASQQSVQELLSTASLPERRPQGPAVAPAASPAKELMEGVIAQARKDGFTVTDLGSEKGAEIRGFDNGLLVTLTLKAPRSALSGGSILITNSNAASNGTTSAVEVELIREKEGELPSQLVVTQSKAKVGEAAPEVLRGKISSGRVSLAFSRASGLGMNAELPDFDPKDPIKSITRSSFAAFSDVSGLKNVMMLASGTMVQPERQSSRPTFPGQQLPTTREFHMRGTAGAEAVIAVRPYSGQEVFLQVKDSAGNALTCQGSSGRTTLLYSGNPSKFASCRFDIPKDGVYRIEVSGVDPRVKPVAGPDAGAAEQLHKKVVQFVLVPMESQLEK